MIKIDLDRVNLWKGCMLVSIAHAINIAHYPELSYENSWDGFNYNVQDGSGIRGTISFHPNYVIAAFRNDNSKRLLDHKEAIQYFTNAPKEVLELAKNETLLYLLERIDDKVMPVITTAFWGTEEAIYSKDDFAIMIENGGSLLNKQMMDTEDAISELITEYEMSKSQIKLLKSIFNQKILNPFKEIVLTDKEITMIGSDDEEGLEESRISFNEIGIRWEI